ncbi:MAG: DUF6541 family protein [Actinomycetaceae bacterium]|nr:hypothetical protein [Actinomycetaceae bacterium]MDY6083617.1 DUF6541 family protein [Actinomycetaceae bacterium]
MASLDALSFIAPSLPVFAVAIVLLWIPGLLLGWAAGLRRLILVAWAPLASVALIATAAICAAWLNIHFSIVPVALLSGAAACIAFPFGRWMRAHESIGLDAHHAQRSFWDIAIVCVIVIVFIVSALHYLSRIGGVDAMSQTIDASYHLNQTQAIVTTRDGSLLDAAHIYRATGSSLYPVGFHDVAALVALTAHATVPEAVNVVTVVAAFLVFPCGIASLAQRAYANTSTTAIATLCSAVFPMFPLTMTWAGTLYANLLGDSLLPAAIAVYCLAWQRTWHSSHRRQTIVTLSLVLVVSIAALAISQPSAVIAFIHAALATGFAFHLHYSRTQVPSHAAHHSDTTALSVGRICTLWSGLALLLNAAMIALVTPQRLGNMTAPNFHGVDIQGGLEHAILLIGSIPGEPAGKRELIIMAPLTILVLIGFVANIRRPHLRWTSITYAVFALLCFLSFAAPMWLQAYTVGFWYADSLRLFALLSVVAPLLAAQGTSQVFAFTARVSPTVDVCVRAAATASFLAYAIMLPTWHASNTWLKDYFYSAQDTRANDLLNSEKYALFEDMKTIVPADAITIGNPWQGATLSWPVSGIRTFLPTLGLGVDQNSDAYYLMQHLNEGSSNPRICPIIREYKIGYAFDFTGSEPKQWVRQAGSVPGLNDTANGNLGPVIAQRGDAKLVQITACGQIPRHN